MACTKPNGGLPSGVHMLNKVENASSSFRSTGQSGVDILSIATAVPENRISQTEAYERARRVFPQLNRLDGLYTNTGIEQRYSCLPTDWYHERHGWEERTEAFQRHALTLLETVAKQCVSDARLELADIDMMVTNTITGLAIP